MRLKRILMPMIGACCMAWMLSGCSLLPVEEEELKPPLVEPAKETLSLYAVKRGNVSQQITGVATFASDKMDYLFYSESGARLRQINVKLGDLVKAGDVLATTETSDLDMKIKLQQISIEKLKITLQQAMAEKDADDPDIRLKLLDMESAQLQLKALQDQLQNSRLTSTINGIVTFIDTIQPGDQVAAYKQLITLSDPKQMKLVYTAASQNDLGGVEVGMDVAIKIKDKSFTGKVVQTPLSAPPNSNKAIQDKNAKAIFIQVDTLPEGVTIGAQADITIVTQKRDDVIIIPRAGLRNYMGRDYVQVLDGESRKEVDVEKGIVAATEVEIRKGLSEGQQIILNN
ncbi:HlyD family efflux transporter periplasmic adaptor subunit [Bacillus sp. 3255]|uniref:efflux RND transporter periplasmic adaptor subunit n=1 Tax=Bacillus sp. 3255 TaxID=2817904 RepID=UPI00286BE2F7|nr:HlyD family efflux transporter periplasmic adaptor subunit [Bacillus sp. 3255]